MRGSLTFSVDLNTQAIRVQADLYEMTDFDLLRFATALNEQSFKILLTLIQKRVQEVATKKIIQDASIEAFKKKVDGNLQ